MLNAQILWHQNGFPWFPLAHMCGHTSPTLMGQSSGSTAGFYPKWGQATGFPSRILLFTHLTPFVIYIYSNEQMAFPPQKDFPVLLTLSSDSSITCTQITSHVTLFPPGQFFHYSFLMMDTWRCMTLDFLEQICSSHCHNFRAVAFIWSLNYFKSFPCHIQGAWWHAVMESQIWCHQWSNLTNSLWQVR